MVFIILSNNAPIMAEPRPLTCNDVEKLDVIKSTIPLITKVKSPKVSIVKGRAKKEIIGFIIIFIIPNTAEAHNAPVRPVIEIPSIKKDTKYKESAPANHFAII
jgi:hypothetical protein